MKGLEFHELLGLLRVGLNEREDGVTADERFEREWGQDYDPLAQLAVLTGSPASFMLGVETGLRLGAALNDLEEIRNAR